MTPKYFSDRFHFYTIYLRKITQKNLEKKKRIVCFHLSPGMQEDVADHRGKKRNTCIKIIQFVYYAIKKRGHIVKLFFYRPKGSNDFTKPV